MLTDCLEKRLIDYTRHLIRIPSPSGGEGESAHYLKDLMGRMGFRRLGVDALGNVFGSLIGTRPGLRLLLDAHLDTVGVGDHDLWSVDPLGGLCRADRLYGRGASDMKGAAAAMLLAAQAWVEDRKGDFAGEIGFSGTVCEEPFEGIAARLISERFQPDAVIIGEATDLKINRGQRGRAEVRVEARGRAAHSSNPDAGCNAVYGMMAFLGSLRQRAIPKHPVLGPGIIELTDIISSPYPGASTVPERCIVTLDRRLLVDETMDDVLQPLREVAQAVEADWPGLKLKATIETGRATSWTGEEIRAKRFYPAWLIPEDHFLVKSAQEALRGLGWSGDIGTYSFCTNGSHYAGEAGIPTIGFGPAQEERAHVVDEFVTIPELKDAFRGYYALIDALMAD